MVLKLKKLQLVSIIILFVLNERNRGRILVVIIKFTLFSPPLYALLTTTSTPSVSPENYVTHTQTPSPSDCICLAAVEL